MGLGGCGGGVGVAWLHEKSLSGLGRVLDSAVAVLRARCTSRRALMVDGVSNAAKSREIRPYLGQAFVQLKWLLLVASCFVTSACLLEL